MTSLGIVWAQMRQRALQTVLGVALLALGVATLVFVVLVQTQLVRQLTRDAEGIDLVVGAKGSPLQLILSAIYHVDVPTGNIPLKSIDTLRANPLVAQVIPVSLGDSFRGFRIVGTEPALIEQRGARMAQGALWQAPMQAVLGAEVARATGIAVGQTLAGTHGLRDGGAVHDDAVYSVTGILAPTGGVLDRLVLTDQRSVWQVHEGEASDPAEKGILEAEREVTALLVRYASPMGAAIVPRQVNADGHLMAAAPAVELARLFAVTGVGIDTMRAFAWVLMGAATLALFVTLLTALEERRHDIAIMRLLGASRARIAGLLLLEAWLLAAMALALGLALGLGAVALVGGWLDAARAFTLSPAELAPGVFAVAAMALAVATLAAIVPVWRASRMDVAATLARG